MPQALEVVLRVSVIYVALLALLRVGGRKELAQHPHGHGRAGADRGRVDWLSFRSRRIAAQG